MVGTCCHCARDTPTLTHLDCATHYSVRFTPLTGGSTAHALRHRRASSGGHRRRRVPRRVPGYGHEAVCPPKSAVACATLCPVADETKSA